MSIENPPRNLLYAALGRKRVLTLCGRTHELREAWLAVLMAAR